MLALRGYVERERESVSFAYYSVTLFGRRCHTREMQEREW